MTAYTKRFAQTLEFIRHIPATKLRRRCALTMRRFLRDRVARDFPMRHLERRQVLPKALFAPRLGHLEVGDLALRFTFLGRTEELPRAGFGKAMTVSSADQLWRMNLHYMEYLEEASDLEWIDLVKSWIYNNPFNRPGAWRDGWNSYAVSLRVVVWMQEVPRRILQLPPSASALVDQSLAQQLLFLERNLETDLGGNHLLKNIKALLWGSAYFSGADAERWRTIALNLLRTELGEQVLADGMHYERSASYHCQVFADLLECHQLLANDELSGDLKRILFLMAQVATDLTHPDGLVVQFNDAGLHMAYSPSACLDVYERLFSRRPAPRPVFALPDAGYYGLRNPNSYFVADCGRIAPDDLPAHGHGDVLSFEWSMAGERIIVDQGVFEYVQGTRRSRSRAVASHNTLSLDGTDQADFFGAFRCGRRPNVRVLCHEQTAAGFVLEGTHDGFKRFAGAPRHVRRFEVGVEKILIHDRIEGRRARTASIAYLLHPNVEVNVSGNRAELSHGSASINLQCTSSIVLQDAVWWPDMGKECPTRRLVAELSPDSSEVTSVFSFKNV